MTNDKIPLTTTLSLIDDSSILYFFFIISAMKAGKNRRTASKYLEHGQLPSGLAPKNRKWRTRANPFNEHWPEIEQWLKISPELEAKFIFEQLCEKYPDQEVLLYKMVQRFDPYFLRESLNLYL